MKDQKFFGKSAWTSKMTDTGSGMCHTFIQDKPLCKGTYLHFILNYNITFVLVHDPKFFVFKDNNVFVPFLKLENVFRREFNLIATTKKRMKRESLFDCEPDENYNFENCTCHIPDVRCND